MNKPWKFLGIWSVTALGVFLLAQLTHNHLVDARNRAQLQDLSEQTITRAEVAIDSAIISLMDLVGTTNLRCNDDFISKVRDEVFSGGNLKDVYLIGNNKKCSGFPALGPSTEFNFKNLERFPARNKAFKLSVIKNKEWEGLGVSRFFAPDDELLAITSPESLLFDMLPASLREHASMSLRIKEGPAFARYQPSNWKDNVKNAPSEFVANSSRFPICVHLHIDNDKLADWGHEVPTWVIAITIAISLLFGFLAAKALVRNESLAEELDAALENGEIIPFFQPIVDMKNQEIVGCEMLARWKKPDGSQISPAIFIPVAELSGRADKLMHVLLRQAGVSLSTTFAARKNLKLTFNVTPEQFLSDGFAQRTIALAEEIDMPQNQLFVELTERQELQSVEQANKVMDELAQAGIRVAIDDTGTGHNGLASIQNLKAACMKIDKLFVDMIDKDKRNRTLVEMLVNLANEFNMSLVAEGIEREEQANTLIELGVTEAQGFLYSRPVPADEFIKLLNKGLTGEAAKKEKPIKKPKWQTPLLTGNLQETDLATS